MGKKPGRKQIKGTTAMSDRERQTRSRAARKRANLDVVFDECPSASDYEDRPLAEGIERRLDALMRIKGSLAPDRIWLERERLNLLELLYFSCWRLKQPKYSLPMDVAR